MTKIILFSCYFGAHEPFRPETFDIAGKHCAFLFTDNLDLECPGVEMRSIDAQGLSPVQRSRIPKLMPHKYFADADWVIYIDNTVKLTQSPEDIIAKINAQFDNQAPAGRYVFKHPERSCVYDELRVCFRWDLVTLPQFLKLLWRYVRVRLPRKSGLGQHTILIQKMGDPATDQLNEHWWSLFQSLSRRDQLTLRLAEAETGISTNWLNFSMLQICSWPIIRTQDRIAFQAAAACKATGQKND